MMNYDSFCANLPLAQAYIPIQPYVGLVPLETGFKRGSMFPNLYDPYDQSYGSKKKGDCLCYREEN